MLDEDVYSVKAKVCPGDYPEYQEEGDDAPQLEIKDLFCGVYVTALVNQTSIIMQYRVIWIEISTCLILLYMPC